MLLVSAMNLSSLVSFKFSCGFQPVLEHTWLFNLAENKVGLSELAIQRKQNEYSFLIRLRGLISQKPAIKIKGREGRQQEWEYIDKRPWIIIIWVSVGE